MELKGLKTEFLGQNLIYFKSIDSTQIKVKSLKNPKDGTIVIADNQVSAIGTHDRKWYTGSGKNIAMSFVLIPDCPISKIQNITIEIAECIVNSIKKLYDINLQIKEPNDIFYNNKKVGGILTETAVSSEIVKKIYIGIGLNINQEIFPGNLEEIATSLKKEFKKEFSREDIIAEILNNLEVLYKQKII